MNLQEIERHCRFYRGTRRLGKEKQLLEKTLSNPNFSNWEWGIKRMTELDPGFALLNEWSQFEMEPDLMPTTKQEIADYSFQYQAEWRFEKEKRLIEHALILFPKWKYLQQRIEWHSRPIFHPNPKKSKTQPRKPLYLPRDSHYTPNQESIESLCFITGASSNAPYFELCIQLIESIKATRWYNKVSIKVLDCGLTQEDADYLVKQFNCEVKDPGWDVPEEYVKVPEHLTNKNTLKGITSRHCLHKQFPGYKYYAWIDCDTWIQSEIIFDQYLKICELQDFCGTYFGSFDQARHWHYILSPQQQAFLANKDCVTGGFWIMSKDLMQKYNFEIEDYVRTTKTFHWGTDDSLLTFTMHKYLNMPIILKNKSTDGTHIDKINLKVDNDLNIYDGNAPLFRVSFDNIRDELSHRVLFDPLNEINYFKASLRVAALDPVKSEEYCHKLCTERRLKNGSLFYRTYPAPEKL